MFLQLDLCFMQNRFCNYLFSVRGSRISRESGFAISRVPGAEGASFARFTYAVNSLSPHAITPFGLCLHAHGIIFLLYPSVGLLSGCACTPVHSLLFHIVFFCRVVLARPCPALRSYRGGSRPLGPRLQLERPEPTERGGRGGGSSATAKRVRR